MRAEREAGGHAAGGHVRARREWWRRVRVCPGRLRRCLRLHVLRAATMRAEVGDEFVLTEEDFPPACVVQCVAPREAFSAHNLQLAPRIYATFYTPQIDSAGRYTLWVGVPVTFFLLSCCCCCCLCLCCGVPDDGGKAHRVEGHELADLTRAQEILSRSDLEEEEEDDDDEGAARRGGEGHIGQSLQRKTTRRQRMKEQRNSRTVAARGGGGRVRMEPHDTDL